MTLSHSIQELSETPLHTRGLALKAGESASARFGLCPPRHMSLAGKWWRLLIGHMWSVAHSAHSTCATPSVALNARSKQCPPLRILKTSRSAARSELVFWVLVCAHGPGSALRDLGAAGDMRLARQGRRALIRHTPNVPGEVRSGGQRCRSESAASTALPRIFLAALRANVLARFAEHLDAPRMHLRELALSAMQM